MLIGVRCEGLGVPWAVGGAHACAGRRYGHAAGYSARVAQIQGIEVYLPNHGWNPGTDYPNGSLFERFPKLLARKAGEPNPFVDPASWKQNIAQTQVRIAKGLEEEKKKAAAGGGAPLAQ